MSLLPTDLPIYDPLTGAYSRALYERRVEEEVARSRRSQRPCSLCLFDLDYFKSINDAYGHSRGDQVLREVAARVMGAIRRFDMLFRYGGDEFVLLLPNTSAPQALALMERLMEQVAATPFGDAVPLAISLSMGVATFPDDAGDAAGLFERADRRNGIAKRRGRRQLASDDGEPSLAAIETQRLIERDLALNAGRQFLDRLAERGLGALRIVGGAGVGATSVLTALADLAQMRGFAVLRLAGTCAQRSRTYGALKQAGWPLPPFGSPGQICAALRAAAAERGAAGLVVAIDSAEQLDRATLALFDELCHDAPIAVGVIYTVADPHSDPLPAAGTAGETVALHPLSEQGALIWLREALRAEPPQGFLRWFHRETRGRPASMRRLIEALVEQGILSVGADGALAEPDYAAAAAQSRALADRDVPHNLPGSVTDLVGREVEVRQVARHLAGGRMVTLVGPGGIGKTRLALQVAAELSCRASGGQRFPDGVWFVPLAAVETPGMVGGAIARALGGQGGSDQQVAAWLRDTLRARRTLLVLDNCEHVVDMAGLVAELLDAAPGLQVLATSRIALRVYGEQLYAVPPLGLPPRQQHAAWPPETPRGTVAGQYDALALFISRARLAAPDLELDDEQLAAVMTICDRLDGLPLAIEMAAARCDAMTPGEMNAQFASALDLSAAGPRSAPRRQQALRETIGWSYRLLAPAERRLLARLAVFVGGFTLDAAVAVAPGADGEPACAELLAALVRSSLVRPEAAGAGAQRYGMLETIREYALERLDELGDSYDAARRHAEHFQALAAAAEPWLLSAAQLSWVLRLEADHANLRGALAWFAEQGQTSAAARMVAAMWRVWTVLHYADLGRGWVARLLAAEPPPAPPERARLLLAGGTMAWQQGDYDEAAAALDECIALGRAHGDAPTLSSALNNRGLVARERGEYERAVTLFGESLQLRRDQSHAWGIALTLGNLARVALYRGELDQALAFSGESLDLFRALGDRWGTSMSAFDRGETLLLRGDLAGAQALLAESLELARSVGDRSQIGATLTTLAEVAELRGDPAAARGLVEEALALYLAIGEKEGVAVAIERCISLAVRVGALERAARLVGAVEHLRAAIGAPLPQPYQPAYIARRAEVAAALGEQALGLALAEGGRMSLAETVALALRPLDQPAPGAGGA